MCLRCSLHHILSLIVHTFRENREFVYISIVQFMVSANNRKRLGLQIVFICLYITPSHYYHCANFIWRHWTYKMPVRYNLSSVWVRFTYSLSYPLYNMWDCVFSVYPFPLGWLREYIYVVWWSSSNRKYELLPIVSGLVMKQWYALYVFLYSYGTRNSLEYLEAFYIYPACIIWFLFFDANLCLLATLNKNAWIFMKFSR